MKLMYWVAVPPTADKDLIEYVMKTDEFASDRSQPLERNLVHFMRHHKVVSFVIPLDEQLRKAGEPFEYASLLGAYDLVLKTRAMERMFVP